jgi:hypothetical protein
MARQVYQLKVTLTDVAPAVWRRVALPGGYTLDRLHRVIQYAMGWQDYHLHSFEVNGISYGMPDPEGELDLRDELDVRLSEVAAEAAKFRYTYDFGDWWEHEIVVEAVADADPEERYPVCLGGERACPPEDVGGAYGYERFLQALADPAHADHAAMVEWIGRRFDPEAFDADRASALLRRMA